MTQPTYADLLRNAMRKNNRMTRRQLNSVIGYSYEHVRKIVSGLPLMSEDFNAKACKALGLNEAEMWQVALREKSQRRGMAADILPPDDSVANIWSEMTIENRGRIKQIMLSVLEVQRTADRIRIRTAEETRLEISKLTNELGDKMHQELTMAMKGGRPARPADDRNAV